MQGDAQGAAGVPPTYRSVFSRPVSIDNESNGETTTNSRLRRVQVDNFVGLREHFPTHRRILADMCTGSGKSGLACMAPYALVAAGKTCKRVLWIGPTIPAREGENRQSSS